MMLWYVMSNFNEPFPGWYFHTLVRYFTTLKKNKCPFLLYSFPGFITLYNMALSKRMQDLSTGSDTEKGDLCAACKVDGEYRRAVKFCLDCNQPICQSCTDSHRRIKQIQGHQLVDNKSQDAVKVAQILSSVLTCPKHPDKIFLLICVDHDALCCSRCVNVNHRGCRQKSMKFQRTMMSHTHRVYSQTHRVC